MKISFQIIIEINKVAETTSCVSKVSWKRLITLVRGKHNAMCQYCGEFSPDGHLDHIVPLSKGGTDQVDNLTWACSECNRRKGDSIWEPSSTQIRGKQVVPIAILHEGKNKPTPYNLPVSRKKLNDVATAVLVDGAPFSRRALRDVLSQNKYTELSESMLASGLLLQQTNGKRSVTQAGKDLLTLILSETEKEVLEINARHDIIPEPEQVEMTL